MSTETGDTSSQLDVNAAPLVLDPASAFHLQLAEDRCQRLLEWLEEQKAKLFPTDAALLLLDACTKAIERMSSRLAGAKATASAYPSGQLEYIQRETGSVHDFINGLEADFLPDLVGAEVPTTTGAVPQLLQRLTNALVGDCSLLVKTVPEFNYASGVLTPQLRFLFDAAGCGGLLQEFPKHFSVVSISSFTPNAILTHTLVAHEIGHILYGVHDLDEQLSTDFSYEAVLQEKLGTSPSPAVVASLKQQVAEWREEFTCDLLGLCLLGPAYVYALTGFLTATGGTSGLDSASTHPSPRMRISLMLDAMQGRYGGLGFETHSVPLIDDLREFFPGGPLGSLDDLAFEILQQDFREMLRIAREKVGDELYTPESYQRDSDILGKRLTIAVPPNEYDDTYEPASFASILNAAWAFYLDDRDLPSLGATLTIEQRKQRFYGLISWALEAAEFALSWRHIRRDR